MVIVEPWPYPNDQFPILPDPYPIGDPYPYPMEWPHPKKAKARHIKDVKKGIMIEFDDNTWIFIATDDACYEKIKKALKDDT